MKPAANITQRVPACEIEDLVSDFAARLLKANKRPLDEVTAVHLHADRIECDLSPDTLHSAPPRLMDGETILFQNKQTIRIAIHISLPRRGGRCTIVPSKNRKPRPDKALIKALRKAHRMVRTERGLPVIHVAPISPYDRKIQRLAFLSPGIQSDILKGLQPPSLNLKKLLQLTLPLDWDAQKAALGWIESAAPCSSCSDPCSPRRFP